MRGRPAACLSPAFIVLKQASGEEVGPVSTILAAAKARGEAANRSPWRNPQKWRGRRPTARISVTGIAPGRETGSGRGPCGGFGARPTGMGCQTAVVRVSRQSTRCSRSARWTGRPPCASTRSMPSDVAGGAHSLNLHREPIEVRWLLRCADRQQAVAAPRTRLSDKEIAVARATHAASGLIARERPDVG